MEGVKKTYLTKGRFGAVRFEGLGLPHKITKVLGRAANFSLAELTWRIYRAAFTHISRAEAWAGVQFHLPFTPRMTVTYVGYLLGKPKPCKGETIEKYFSGLRMFHLEQGFNPPCLRSNFVKQILSGAKKMDVEREKLEGKRESFSVTIPILKLLKQAIKCNKKWSLCRKILMLCVACLAFNGSFRIHELLSREEETFDPTQNLLGEGCERENYFIK